MHSFLHRYDIMWTKYKHVSVLGLYSETEEHPPCDLLNVGHVALCQEVYQRIGHGSGGPTSSVRYHTTKSQACMFLFSIYLIKANISCCWLTGTCITEWEILILCTPFFIDIHVLYMWKERTMITYLMFVRLRILLWFWLVEKFVDTCIKWKTYY